MAILPIKGKKMGLYFEKPAGSGTYEQIGCADEVSLEVNTEEVETSCVDSGDFKEFEGGDIDWTISVSGGIRQATNSPTGNTDADDNITAENLLDLQLAGAKLLVRFSLGEGAGTVRYGGNVLITSNSLTGARKDAGKFSTKLRGTGALAKTIQS